MSVQRNLQHTTHDVVFSLAWFLFQARYSGVLAYLPFVRKGCDVQVHIWVMADWPIVFYHNFSAGSVKSPSYVLGDTFAREAATESHTSIT